MKILAIAFLLIAALTIFYFSRARKRTPPHKNLKQYPPNPVQKNKPFHAVTIVCGDQACAAARNATGVKYLSGEAPGLPLAGCKTPACTCRYEHYEDRREDDDRRFPFESRNNPASAYDKRIRDRRASRQSRQNDS